MIWRIFLDTHPGGKSIQLISKLWGFTEAFASIKTRNALVTSNQYVLVPTDVTSRHKFYS